MSAARAEEFITAYHATDATTAARLLEHGTSQPKRQRPATVVQDPGVAKMLGKRVGDHLDYEPGRGMGSGLYLGAHPSDVRQYGDHVLQVSVSRSALSVPPERAHRIKAGMTPERSLAVGDGYTERPLNPTQFRRVGVR